MVNNINNLGVNNQVNTRKPNAAADKGNTTAKPEASKPAQVDSVSITSQAKQLGEIEKQAQSAPAIDKAKIEELKLAINKGEYRVDPQKLAENLANFESNFFK